MHVYISPICYNNMPKQKHVDVGVLNLTFLTDYFISGLYSLLKSLPISDSFHCFCNMISREDCIKKLKDSKLFVAQKFNVHSMKLFGSVAKNKQSELSDVDIAVDMEPNLFLQVGLKQYLEAKLGCNVDVIRYHRGMDEFLIKQIDHDGIVIFS